MSQVQTDLVRAPLSYDIVDEVVTLILDRERQAARFKFKVAKRRGSRRREG